jgi:hypothetical protein
MQSLDLIHIGLALLAAYLYWQKNKNGGTAPVIDPAGPLGPLAPLLDLSKYPLLQAIVLRLLGKIDPPTLQSFQMLSSPVYSAPGLASAPHVALNSPGNVPTLMLPITLHVNPQVGPGPSAQPTEALQIFPPSSPPAA